MFSRRGSLVLRVPAPVMYAPSGAGSVTLGSSGIEGLFVTLRMPPAGEMQRAPRSSLTEGLYRCDEVLVVLPDQVGPTPIRRHSFRQTLMPANVVDAFASRRMTLAATWS
jgi:hypothetical protein